MAVFNSLTFDGENSLDYGIYITGEGVYDAPRRAVEMVTIPGRNGTLAIDQGRFENIDVKYAAGSFGSTQAEYAGRMKAFRNMLASRHNYVRLEDDYHPDEFRLGLYKSGLEVKPVSMSRAGEFDIIFDCKPQRFLKSGETAVTIGEWGETETASGDIVTVENEDGVLAVKSLEVSLSPIQSLNGYSKPWVGGAGKNKFDASTALVGYYVSDSDGNVIASDNGVASDYIEVEAGQTYKISPTLTSGNWGAWYDENKVYISGIVGYSTAKTAPSNAKYMRFTVTLNGSNPNYATTTQVEKGSTQTAWTPYSNLCPISGRTEVKTIVSPTTSATDGRTYTTSLGRTVYGGTLDVVSGVLTVDRKLVNIDPSTIKTNAVAPGGGRYTVTTTDAKDVQTSDPIAYTICNTLKSITSNSAEIGGSSLISSKRLSFMLPVSTQAEARQWFTDNPTTVVYPLAQAQTYQLTAQQIELLMGTNNVWSDSGDVTVEYGQNPSILVNPTLFESKPLLVVTGRGNITINGVQIAISATPTTIDCELMEAYNGTTSRNSDIVLTPNKFPVLKPGNNTITLGSGITKVEITPRWWRI